MNKRRIEITAFVVGEEWLYDLVITELTGFRVYEQVGMLSDSLEADIAADMEESLDGLDA